MSKTVKRLLLAAFVSGCGFVSTFAWYKHTSEDSKNMKGAKRIAKLVFTMNEVQRKQAKKLIWQPALESEDLYVGEAIRTSANSEARIEFVGSKAAIDLEPDSAIILEETDGKMALNFLKGNILVKSGGAEGSDLGLTLKSGDKNIALGNSQVSLGKTAGTEDVDLQVLKGSITSNGKILYSSDINKSKINVLSPVPGSPTYLDIKSNDMVLFKWSPISAEYQMSIEAGDARDQLIPISTTTTSGDKGELSAPMKIGKIYFRIIAKSTNPKLPEMTSTVIRAQFLAKIPPMPLSPENDMQLAVNKNDSNVNFLWSNPAGFAKVIFELATNANLQNKVTTQTLDNVTNYSYTITKPGTYFWRVSGVLDGKNKEVISSKIRSFQFKIQDELVPPELEKPTMAEVISEQLAKAKGVALSWKPVVGASQYKVVMNKKSTTPRSANAKDLFVEQGEFLQKTISNLKAGVYEWSVASINKKGEYSKFSEKRDFTIESLPTLDWADKKLKDDHQYISLKPSVTLAWEKGSQKATSWRITIKIEDDSYDPLIQIMRSTGAELSLPKDSIYTADVEALDDRNQVVAKSQTRRFRISPAPLLPAPQYATSVPETLEASKSGSTAVNWLEVSGAAKYVLTIKNPDGSVSREISSIEKEAKLNGLMPGQYKMTLKSIDKNGRVGPEGDEKILRVPATSNVLAPKLKGMQVK
jgi:hypothetical protein